MGKKLLAFWAVALLTFFVCKNVYSLEEAKMASEGAFDKIYQEAAVKEGIKEITYAQFMEIRGSDDKYVLLDARNIESFNSGHISGAISAKSNDLAEKVLSKLAADAKIIVYCGGFSCHASTQEARDLLKLGFTRVLDYKGGTEEWQKKGNQLVK